MSRLLFLNLPVVDLPASRTFFDTLGFAFDERFCDDQAACMVVSDQAYVMLLARDRFADFVVKPVADARDATALTVATVPLADPQRYDTLHDEEVVHG